MDRGRVGMDVRVQPTGFAIQDDGSVCFAEEEEGQKLDCEGNNGDGTC